MGRAVALTLRRNRRRGKIFSAATLRKERGGRRKREIFGWALVGQGTFNPPPSPFHLAKKSRVESFLLPLKDGDEKCLGCLGAKWGERKRNGRRGDNGGGEENNAPQIADKWRCTFCTETSGKKYLELTLSQATSLRESAPQFISHFCFLHVLRLFFGGGCLPPPPPVTFLLRKWLPLPPSFQPISSNLHHYPFVAVITFHDARDEMGERQKEEEEEGITGGLERTGHLVKSWISRLPRQQARRKKEGEKRQVMHFPPYEKEKSGA